MSKIEVDEALCFSRYERRVKEGLIKKRKREVRGRSPENCGQCYREGLFLRCPVQRRINREIESVAVKRIRKIIGLTV